MPDSQVLTSNPRDVALHDGTGKAFSLHVTKEDVDTLHVWGYAWCDDPDNGFGWSEGSINSVREAGQLPVGDDGIPQAYSWSELKED